jgi:hypothetical protein
MKQMDKNDELKCNQLSNAVAMAAKEDQIIWTIFGVFWAANAILLVALFTEGGIPTDLVGVTVSFVGVLFSVIWCLIQQRAINWLKYYEKLIFNIEEKLEMPDDCSISAWRNKRLFNDTIGNGVRVRVLMIVSGLVSSIAWVISFLIFLIRLCCQ